MRLALAALIAAAPLALASAPPAAAQPAAGWTELRCQPDRQYPAELRDLPVLGESPPDAPQRMCSTMLDLPSGAPFRRLAVFQLVGTYWCGTAGCSTMIYGQDARGRWVDISPQDTMTNAQEESVRVNRARAFHGMPRLAIRTGGGGAGPGVEDWGWVPRLNCYAR